MQSITNIIHLQLNQIYDEYVELENDCEELINEVIETKYTQFLDLLKKPNSYGQSFEVLGQVAR